MEDLRSGISIIKDLMLLPQQAIINPIDLGLSGY
jgi:hypothetical protein